MGCDITLFLEVKFKGQWRYYGKYSVQRDYHLFSLMANVRNNKSICPIADPRGFPKDIDELTAFSAEISDGEHSESYLNRSELELISENLIVLAPQLHDDLCLTRIFEDTRAIFSFDS